ncbi:Acg family FMN-binding oxidoreductase [Leptospira ilyithenensis]|uniref:Nitroreductase domain-containing protein n=1 Tax=Leptospira ilyithenensis TaxID=2484901 RepID=A0A4R9LL95_9LEPT|nr:hypothetical protein [Leptospira ilyithenensis]TGN06527.1 hypothetical protein EHS11_19435 [Leptospira ilyithenensis]
MNHPFFSRKKFIFKVFQTSAIFSLSPVLGKLYAYGKEESQIFRQDPFLYAENIGLKKPIEKIILTATIAPNSHNTQPWRIKIESDSSFLLYGDDKRTLPAIDPINRQFYHTQGTYLELAKLAADALGYDSKISLFPKGIPSAKQMNVLPVAGFQISPIKQRTQDSLFLSLPKRQMNRSEYSGDWITEDESKELRNLTNPNSIQLKFILGEDQIQSYLPFLIDSFAMETNLKAQNEVTRVWFRKESEDVYSKRDGLSLEGNGVSGIKAWIAKKFFLDLSYEGWHSEASKNASIELFKSQAKSSKGLVLFISKGNDDAKEWIRTGMDFMRFSLAAAGKNLAFHTMNQALEDYPESLGFYNEIKSKLGLQKKERIQLLGRLGRSDYHYESPRRDLKEILI